MGSLEDILQDEFALVVTPSFKLEPSEAYQKFAEHYFVWYESMMSYIRAGSTDLEAAKYANMKLLLYRTTEK